MKQHAVLNLVLILAGLTTSSNSLSHPFDSPLTFRQHLTNDGRVIFSNIEKRCFSNGVLTCQEYHPIWEGRFGTVYHEQTIDKASISEPGSQDVSNAEKSNNN